NGVAAPAPEPEAVPSSVATASSAPTPGTFTGTLTCPSLGSWTFNPAITNTPSSSPITASLSGTFPAPQNACKGRLTQGGVTIKGGSLHSTVTLPSGTTLASFAAAGLPAGSLRVSYTTTGG